MLRADARERLIACRVRHRIRAQNVDVMREFATELFELNRLRRSACGPQASRTFPAKSDAGMCFPGFGGGRTHTVNRLEKSDGVRSDVSIKRKAGAALDGAINVHTLRAQLLQKMCPVRLRHQDNRGIGGVQGGSNTASKALDNSGVIRTEEDLVTTWSGSIGRFGKRETATHESLAREYGVDRGQQVSRGRYLLNVTMGAQTERRVVRCATRTPGSGREVVRGGRACGSVSPLRIHASSAS